MSLGAGAYQVGEAGQCSREQPPPGTVKYLTKVPTNTYLALS